MPCTANLSKLIKPCGNAAPMGGIRAVYLRGYGPNVPFATDYGGRNFALSETRIQRGSWVINYTGQDQGPGTNYLSDFFTQLAACQNKKLFYKVDLTRTGSSLVSNLQVNEDNGTRYFQHVLTIQTSGLSSDAVEFIDTLLGLDVTAIVELWDGSLLLLGCNEAARVSAVESTTGTNWGDRQGHDIQIMEFSPDSVPVGPLIAWPEEQIDASDFDPEDVAPYVMSTLCVN